MVFGISAIVAPERIAEVKRAGIGHGAQCGTTDPADDRAGPSIAR
jgi:hypothetical protein